MEKWKIESDAFRWIRKKKPEHIDTCGVRIASVHCVYVHQAWLSDHWPLALIVEIPFWETYKQKTIIKIEGEEEEEETTTLVESVFRALAGRTDGRMNNRQRDKNDHNLEFISHTNSIRFRARIMYYLYKHEMKCTTKTTETDGVLPQSAQ